MARNQQRTDTCEIGRGGKELLHASTHHGARGSRENAATTSRLLLVWISKKKKKKDALQAVRPPATPRKTYSNGPALPVYPSPLFDDTTMMAMAPMITIRVATAMIGAGDVLLFRRVSKGCCSASPSSSLFSRSWRH